MARKRWTPQAEVTPALLKSREKRKWQINLRRYVIEKSSCPSYAPYFGLDINQIRNWFEIQFTENESWDDFGKKWQFDHIIPVTYFDFDDENELKLCWNFTNLRVGQIPSDKNKSSGLDVLAAKAYFGDLYKKTLYMPCRRLLEKIDQIESSAIVRTEPQQQFIIENKTYLDMIKGYSTFEFELLNSGRSLEEVKKEIDFMNRVKGD